MADKKSFVMYKSWKDLFNSLPKEMAGELIQAVFCYQDGEEVHIDNPALSAIFSLMQTKFDEDIKAYKDKCLARAEAGKRGGKAKGSKNKQKEANAIFAKQDEAKHGKSPLDTDTDTDTDVPYGTIADSSYEESVSAEPTASNRVPYQEIIDLYNSVCVSFPQVTRLTEQRRKTIRSRYREYGMDGIRKVFESAEASDFLSGRNGKWTNCSYDWLMKQGNFLKVFEGNYPAEGSVRNGASNTSYSEAELEEIFADSIF